MKHKIFKKFKKILYSANYKNNFLSTRVKKEKKSNKEIQRILKGGSKPLWIPSMNSFLKVFLFSIVLFFISHPNYLDNIVKYFSKKFFNLINYDYIYVHVLIGNFDYQIPTILFDNNHYQNFIAIHAGIGAVLIGLAFFVAQSLTDKNDPERGRVLLYKSYFFPLLTTEIFVFFIFLWGELSVFTIIPIVIVALLTIWSLASVITILIKDHEMEKAKIKMFFNVIKDSFIKILDKEITKRVGSNWLYKKYKENPAITVSHYGPIGRDEYIAFESNKTGTFSDLNIGKLEKFISEVKNINLKYKNISEKFDSGETQKDITTPNEFERLICLVPMYYTNIEAGDKLLYIKKEIFKNLKKEEKDKLINILKDKARDIFIIKDIKDPENEAKIEITKLKDKSIKAINNIQTGELDKLIDLYVDLIDKFYEFMKMYGGGFSSEQAKNERVALFDERLKPIDWLSRDIREIFERGIKSENINIIRRVAYLPIILSKKAIDNVDHLIFQEFIYYPQLLYSYAYDEKQKENKRLMSDMFDRAWRYLKELCDYHLEPKAKDKNYSLDAIKQYSVHILKIFQGLLLSAVKNSDNDNFIKFIDTAKDLFGHLNNYSYRLEKNRSTEIYKYIDKKRNQMLFGLSGWILHLLRHNQDSQELKNILNKSMSVLSEDAIQITNIFVEAHDFKTEDFWGWDHWEIEEKGEGRVHSIQILEKLEVFYIVKMLNILSNKTPENISNITLPPSRDLAFLADGTRVLLKTIEDIKNNSGNWEFILNNNASSKADDLINLLKKAKEDQEKNEIEEKKKRPISQKKVGEFKKKIVKSFQESSSVREIFVKYLNQYVDKTNNEWMGEASRFGINIVDNKAAFFDKWHVSYVGWGDNYGQDLAHGENSNILKTISDRCEVVPIDDFETKIKSHDNINDLIILTTDPLVLWNKYFKELKNFIPDWRTKDKIGIKSFAGWYKIDNQQIPIFESFYRKRKKEILILDKNKIGQLIQHSPLNKNEDSNLKKNIFYINVKSFSEDESLLKEFTERKPPEWLKDIGNKEEQKSYLKERVLIHVFERFELKIAENFNGYKVVLNEKDIKG